MGLQLKNPICVYITLQAWQQPQQQQQQQHHQQQQLNPNNPNNNTKNNKKIVLGCDSMEINLVSIFCYLKIDCTFGAVKIKT